MQVEQSSQSSIHNFVLAAVCGNVKQLGRRSRINVHRMEDKVSDS